MTGSLALLLFLAALAVGACLATVVVWRAMRAASVGAPAAEAATRLALFEERIAARDLELQRRDLLDEARQKEIAALQEELGRVREARARLEAELEREQREAQGKLAVLDEARAALAAQFKSLAGEILEEKGKRLSDQHRAELDLLLKPLGEKIQSFEKRVEETYVNEAKERFSLAEEVRKLQAANLQISQEAVNLTRALKGDAKARGNWGEVILERVLERSGLTKGREYDVQVTLVGEAGRLRPDVVVRLPDDRHIVIDSKVSLVAYDRYHAASEDPERDAALREHVAAVRRHVDELAGKNYQAQAGLNTPDFVALFMPIEPAFYLAAARDDALYLDAFEKKVVIVTPSTLLAMLSTVATLWRREQQTQNAIEIARRSGELYDKFVGFVEALQAVGRALTTAQRSYDLALDRLSQGRGNLVRRAEDLRLLGLRTEKSLPPELITDAEEEPSAAEPHAVSAPGTGLAGPRAAEASLSSTAPEAAELPDLFAAHAAPRHS